MGKARTCCLAFSLFCKVHNPGGGEAAGGSIKLTVVKLKARILVGYVQCFEEKSYVMTFSENKF